MTYRKRASQTYKRRRVSRVKAGQRHLKAAAITSRGSSFKPRSAAAQTFYANIMDLTRFLARYLSGKRNVMISTDKSRTAGYSVSRDLVRGKPYYHIRVPDWQSYDLPLKGFDKYRIYRSGVWHESSHIRYTPDQVYCFGSNSLEHDVIN